MPHVLRLIGSRKICATKLALISESFVHCFHVLRHRGLSAGFERAQVTREALILVHELLVSFHTPGVRKYLVTLVTSIILLP